MATALAPHALTRAPRSLLSAVEPQALFTEHIEFDVFRFMKNHDIGYGWLTGPRLYWLDDASSHLPKPDSSRAEKGISPRDGAAGTCDLVACNMDGGHSHDFMTCMKGVQTKAMNCLGPRTQLGSVAFFQSEGHEALIQHSLREHCDAQPVDDDDSIPGVRTIRRFPRYRLGTSRRVTRGIKPKFPEPTSAPVISVLLYHVALGMEKHHSHWVWICEDISRQAHIPGLQSGNTVIDERNFTPSHLF
ncbi:hypothetical protein V2G26_000281 [Clonostachys chloroleuca]